MISISALWPIPRVFTLVGMVGLLIILSAFQTDAKLAVVDTDFAQAQIEALPTVRSLVVPSYLQPIGDSPYGGKVTLVTGEPDTPILGLPNRNWLERTRHQYSSHQAWNADSSLIYLARGKVFLDGVSYEPVDLPPVPKGLWQWSPAEPEIMIIPNDEGVGKWHVKKGEWEERITLPDYSDFSFQTRTSPSNDGSRVGLKAIRKSDSANVCIGVDFANKTIGSVISFDDYGFTLGERPEVKARRCSVTPSGRYLFLNGTANNSYNDQGHWFDWQSGELVFRQRENNSVECPGGHGDMGLDANGDDVFVGKCKGSGKTWSEPFWRKSVALRVKDGAMSVVGPGLASHTSCRNTARLGWCYGSSYGEDGLIFAHRLDGSRTEVYLDPQNHRIEYDDETQAVPSPDGRKILFVSRWNDSFADGRRMFVLDVSELER